MTKTRTIRPHRRCLCGSKKKYRNCCGKENKIDFNELPKETQQMFRRLQLKQKVASQYHHEHMGYTPEIGSVIFQGRRLVALGGTLVSSDDPKNDWEEPSDFLISHLKTTLGNEWYDLEQQKASDERHIILTWAINSNYEAQDAQNSIESRKHNGSALALLHLAYDLFVLNNQGHITDKFISRLKSEKGFNGARYELFVLATMIRSGFQLKLFDETLGAGKVTECEAIHKQTGISVQVEAKTRNVKYVLGSTEGKAKNIKLYNKLKDAIKKDVDQPYIIFMDLNFPELNVYAENEKINKVREEHEKLIKLHPGNLPNAIIYTNIPFHYARDYSVADNSFGLIKINKPKKNLEKEDIILNEIYQALKQYKFLPREFEESNKHAESLINSIKDNK